MQAKTVIKSILTNQEVISRFFGGTTDAIAVAVVDYAFPTETGDKTVWKYSFDKVISADRYQDKEDAEIALEHCIATFFAYCVHASRISEKAKKVIIGEVIDKRKAFPKPELEAVICEILRDAGWIMDVKENN